MVYIAKTSTLLNVLFHDYCFFKVFEGQHYSSYYNLLRLVESQPGGVVVVAHPHEQKVTGSSPGGDTKVCCNGLYRLWRRHKKKKKPCRNFWDNDEISNSYFKIFEYKEIGC